jgi:predicted kinase
MLAEVAEELGLPFALVHCEAPEEKRRAWIRKRNGDASEATEELLDQQKDWFEPLTDEEKTHTIHLHTEQENVAAAVADRIRQHFGISSE